MEGKRRFSEDQIRSLESMFEAQSKLEPQKKAQLASELGLEPRQVAIWFQNRRARWRSKQLEREYSNLKADYHALLSSFESLKTEKQALVKQLQNIAELAEKRMAQSSGNSDKGDMKSARGVISAKFAREGSGHEEEAAAGSLASAEHKTYCLNCSCSDGPGLWEFWPVSL